MKLMQVLKNRKGFTLMELIVVLIIIAILMAALLPALIGWINDAREASLRAEGRTALLAIQSVVTEAQGTGTWNGGAAFTTVTQAVILGDTKFQELIRTSNIYNAGATPARVFQGAIGGQPGVVTVQMDGATVGTGNVVGVTIGSNVRPGQDPDGTGTNGTLLVGRMGTTTIG